jgi:hypothetical protein
MQNDDPALNNYLKVEIPPQIHPEAAVLRTKLLAETNEFARSCWCI